MLFSLKGLASALLPFTAFFGAAVEHLEKMDQTKGLDVLPQFSWYTAKAAGYSFAYIKTTKGGSKGNGTLAVRCRSLGSDRYGYGIGEIADPATHRSGVQAIASNAVWIACPIRDVC